MLTFMGMRKDFKRVRDCGGAGRAGVMLTRIIGTVYMTTRYRENCTNKVVEMVHFIFFKCFWSQSTDSRETNNTITQLF